MSSITMSNETIHGIVCRVKRTSSPFLTETQVKLCLGTLSKASWGWRIWLAWRSIGNPNFLIRSRFFSRPPAPA
uniref:Uncharacterized protein n=1 Tax=Kalanchoe fedtschenkoi TaxID=63787 RepID=A0A7N0RCC1_KALFE